jgi:hypothetical protein
MCPMCLATAALIAGSATSTGGLTAIVVKKFGTKSGVDHNSVPTPSELFLKENEARKAVPNLHQRRN